MVLHDTPAGQPHPVPGGASPLECILDALGDRVASRSGDSATARCPAHEDRNPSLSIDEASDGRVLLRCHAGCRTQDVVAALGLEMRQLFPSSGETRDADRSPGQLERYKYYDANDSAWFQVCVLRFPDERPKRVWSEYWVEGTWRTRRGKCGVELIPDEAKRERALKEYERLRRLKLPPFRLQAALRSTSRTIFAVEGEKDVLSLLTRELLATTNAGGAKGVDRLGDRALARAIKGRTVVLIPDNDDAGEEWVHAMGARCLAHAERVLVLRLPGLPPGGDVSDWLEAGHTRDELVELAQEAPEHTPPAPEGPVDKQGARHAQGSEEKEDDLEARRDELNSYPFRNFEAEIEEVEKEGRLEKKLIERALGAGDVTTRILEKASGWPKRLDRSLFVDDGAARFLHSPNTLFAFLSSRGEVSWKQGRDKEGRNFLTKAEAFEALASEAEAVDAISPVPLEPEVPGVYVLASSRKNGRGDGGHLRQLLAFFRFAEPRDEALGQALFLSSFWGGPPGHRPLIIVTGRAGCGVQASGKTTLAELLLLPAGDPFRIEFAKYGADALTKQLVSDPALEATGTILDNFERLESAELAELVTARKIHGRPSHGRQRCRVNRLTWAATAVSPTLSADLASRTFLLRIEPADHAGRPRFRSEVERFVEAHREELVADALTVLREGPRCEVTAPQSRFPEWDEAVLATHPAANEALAAREEDLRDVDGDLAGVVTFAEELLRRHGEGCVERVSLAPRELAAAWNEAFTGHSVTTKWISRRLNEWAARGQLPRAIRQPQGSTKRGRPWDVDLVALRRWLEEEEEEEGGPGVHTGHTGHTAPRGSRKVPAAENDSGGFQGSIGPGWQEKMTQSENDGGYFSSLLRDCVTCVTERPQPPGAAAEAASTAEGGGAPGPDPRGDQRVHSSPPPPGAAHLMREIDAPPGGAPDAGAACAPGPGELPLGRPQGQAAEPGSGASPPGPEPEPAAATGPPARHPESPGPAGPDAGAERGPEPSDAPAPPTAQDAARPGPPAPAADELDLDEDEEVVA